jgi:hypothetical protein
MGRNSAMTNLDGKHLDAEIEGGLFSLREDKEVSLKTASSQPAGKEK